MKSITQIQKCKSSPIIQADRITRLHTFVLEKRVRKTTGFLHFYVPILISNILLFFEKKKEFVASKVAS